MLIFALFNIEADDPIENQLPVAEITIVVNIEEALPLKLEPLLLFPLQHFIGNSASIKFYQ